MTVSAKRLAVGLAALAICGPSAWADEPLQWRGWDTSLFASKPADKRLVILDLEAVWCHWCHVMEETTYRDPKVVALLKSKFTTVRVDQDANPDLSNRYGDWGWPATIIFAANGQELVKRRGYLAPDEMAELLQAVIDDPTPGPSAVQQAPPVPSQQSALTAPQRTELEGQLSESFDADNGGWGDVHKFIDTDSMDLLMRSAANGNTSAAQNARKTFDAALNLIDRVSGGLYQYSDSANWKSPHYEKIMWYQAQGLRQYSQAYLLWKDEKYLTAAADIYRYLATSLSNPTGSFYTSQDADVDAALPGKVFYALSAPEREKLGRAPRIDQHVYTRENGWAISGLAAYSAAKGDAKALKLAEDAASFILSHRHRAQGGFAHGDADRAGPYLGDQVAFGQALLDLYAATGERKWLVAAQETGDFIAQNFVDKKGGFPASVAPEASVGAFLNSAKAIDEQVATTRFANALHRYSGAAKFRTLAEHGMHYLASADIVGSGQGAAGILLAGFESANEPAHITVVGSKSAASAIALHNTARAVPVFYKRLDWWDRAEGPLANPDVTYPEIGEAAAFLCTNRICSLPAFTPDDLHAALKRTLKAGGEGPAAAAAH